ncbi:hypothetical protein [Azospirillum brasilense]|uniref:hypothetical protein n=1 Tax=Azospirillum brasilense TaxID=192 RepID=UPI0010C11E11|nr:hypothetical protein [Azospirillum brasilense]
MIVVKIGRFMHSSFRSMVIEAAIKEIKGFGDECTAEILKDGYSEEESNLQSLIRILSYGLSEIINHCRENENNVSISTIFNCTKNSNRIHDKIIKVESDAEMLIAHAKKRIIRELDEYIILNKPDLMFIEYNLYHPSSDNVNHLISADFFKRQSKIEFVLITGTVIDKSITSKLPKNVHTTCVGVDGPRQEAQDIYINYVKKVISRAANMIKQSNRASWAKDETGKIMIRPPLTEEDLPQSVEEIPDFIEGENME